MQESRQFGYRMAYDGVGELSGYWIAENKCRHRGYGASVLVTDFPNGERWVQEGPGKPVFSRSSKGSVFAGGYRRESMDRFPITVRHLLDRDPEFERHLTDRPLEPTQPESQVYTVQLSRREESVLPVSEWSPSGVLGAGEVASVPNGVWRTDEPRPTLPVSPEQPPAASCGDNGLPQPEVLIPVFEMDGELRVDARTLHGVLDSKQQFADWMSNRITRGKLIKDEDFGIIHSAMNNSKRGRPTQDYWLTLDAAKHLAQMEENEQGQKVRRYFINCEKELRRRHPVGTPAAGFDLNSKDGLLMLSAELNSRLIAATERNQQLMLENDQVSAAARASETKALEQARQAAIEDASIPLYKWLDHTQQRHGHGEKVGMKMMRALRLLYKEKIPNCRNSEENRFCAVMNPHLVYSKPTEVEKTKIRHKGTEDELVELVTDGDGKPVILPRNTILVRPGGEEWLMDWFMTRPECALRRMIEHSSKVRGHDVMRRLRGRYSFMEDDKHAWDELSDEEYKQGVRLNRTGGGWQAWCDRGPRRVEGNGHTVEEALLQLAKNYCEERSKQKP